MNDSALLVLAGDEDAAAAAFVDRYRCEGARLLRPADLSCAGWVYRVGDAACSVAVADGVRYPASAIRGVVTRLPGIGPAHLPHVADTDRDYVAAEMSAFLIAWLSALPCPVMNRPVAPSLAGPDWRWERWARLAMALDVPVAPARRVVLCGAESAAAPLPAVQRFVVIGSKVIGPDQPRLAGQSRRLADAAGVPLLGLLFDDAAQLAGIDPWPDIADPSIGAAVFERMQ